MALRFRPADTTFYDLFAQAATHLVNGAALLAEMLGDGNDREGIAQRMRDAEHAADETTHDIIRRVNSTFVTPFDREDIYSLASGLDDVMDFMEEAVDLTLLYEVVKLPSELANQVEVIQRCAELTAESMPRLRTMQDLEEYWIEINRLENLGDKSYRRILAKLFSGPSRAVTVVAVAGLVLAVTASSSATAFAHDTVDVNANAPPWSSVGKIYNSARSSCTGSVIARDKVLTVAHCLYNRATRRFLQAESLHFLLGYKSGEYRAHALVATYSVGANYNPEDSDKSILTDWAILTLTAPIVTLTMPLQLVRKPPAVGEQIMVGGFSQRHPFKMTADPDCRVRGVLPNGLIVHDCVVMHGLSGAPLLKPKADSTAEIVGLHVATVKSMGSSSGLAVPVATFAQQAFSPEH